MTIKIHDVMLTREGAEVGDLPYLEPVRMVEHADHLALVAAAYRDAADACANCAPAPAGGPFSHTNSMRVIAADCQNAVSRRTPADAEAHLTALLRAEYERGKAETDALWSRNSRDTFDAMCAMRDAINEHVPMPSLESDLLQGPEASVFCAAVAEAVIGALLTQGER